MIFRKQFWGGVLLIVVGGPCCLLSPWGPQLEETRGQARLSEMQDRLHRITIALHEYEHSSGHLLLSTVVSDTIPLVDLHGWQTFLLPFVDERTLFAAIDFDRPWTDPVNAPSFQTDVEPFQNPMIDETKGPTGLSLTHYSANSHVLRSPEKPLRFSDITDGTANTLFVGEIVSSLPPWGQPRNVRDPAIGLHTSPDSFGGPWPSGETHFSFLDGRVRGLNKNIDPAVLKAISTPSGGETVSIP
jgi:hypothetical protein